MKCKKCGTTISAWTDIKEEPPERKLLIITDGKKNVGVAFYYKYCQKFFVGDLECKNVVQWTLLPKPTKKRKA